MAKPSVYSSRLESSNTVTPPLLLQSSLVLFASLGVGGCWREEADEDETAEALNVAVVCVCIAGVVDGGGDVVDTPVGC